MLKEVQTQTNVIENCNEAVFCIDNSRNLIFKSKGTEKFFKNGELENSLKEEILNLQNKKLATKIKIGKETYIAVSSPAEDQTTIFLFENHLINQATCNQMYLNKKEGKRTFSELRRKILITLSYGRKTINQVAQETGINWKTVEKHLTYLLGKKAIDEVYSSDYLRIFDLNEKGKGMVEKLRTEEREKIVKEE